jgi:hypothetical protein
MKQTHKKRNPMNQQSITETTLETFGIFLGSQDKTSLLDHLNKTLRERIGVEIAASLNDIKLKELVHLQQTASEAEISAWLNQNVPDLQQIIQDEIDILMGEMSNSSDTINKVT